MDLNIHSLDALIYSHCKSVCALHAHFWEKGSVPRWRVNAVVIIIAATFNSKKFISATNRELVPSSFKYFTLVQVPHIHWLLSFEASTCSFTGSRFWLGHYMLIWGTIVIYQDHFCDKTAAGITGQNGWVRCYDRFKAKISDRRLTIKDGFLLIQRFKEGYFRTVLYAIGCFDFGELQR